MTVNFYGDDASHPISQLDIIDVHAVNDDGVGSTLYILIATPLDAEEYSQKRVLKKIENYLAHIVSDEYRQQYGKPNPASTGIYLKIHKGSDPITFDLLERCREWVEANDVSFTIDTDPVPQSS